MPTEFTVGISEGKFSFNDGDGYMYEEGAKSVKNQADPSYWTITIGEGDIATIQATNKLRFNNSSPRFTTYTSGQADLQLYRKPGAAPAPADYSRPVVVNRFGTICLPNGGTIANAKLYDLDYYDGANTIYLLEVVGNAMEAGRPYVFLPSATTIEVTYTDDADEDAGTYRGLVGSFTEELVTENAGNYILQNNQYWLVNSEAYVGANRAYIHLASVPTEPTPQMGGAPRRRVAMAINGKGSAQGFESIEASEKPMKLMINGQMYILRGEKMYDATGRLVK
jgi:hypothetical protein